MRRILLASAAMICVGSLQTVWAASSADTKTPVSGQVMPNGAVQPLGTSAQPGAASSPVAAPSGQVMPNGTVQSSSATTSQPKTQTQPDSAGSVVPKSPKAPLSTVPTAYATEPGGPKGTLQDALVAAYTGNPTLLAARAQQRALDENIPRATAGWKPTISLQGSWGSSVTDNEFPDTTVPEGPQFGSNPLQGQATISQPVFTGGRTFFGLREAQHTVQAGRARLVSQEQLTLLDAVTAYFDVIQNRATVELNQNNVSVLQKQLDAAQDRFRVGEITRTDVAQAEARLKLGETQLTQAQAQLVASEDAYKTVVGTPAGSLDRAPALPAVPASEDGALATAQINSPSLIAAKETEQASNASVYVAYSQLMPTASVDASYGHTESQSQTNLGSTLGTINNQFIQDQRSVIGNVRVPIYQAGTEFSNIRAAKHTASQNKLLTAQASRDVEENVANAWEALRAATAAIVSTQEQVNANQIAYNGVVQEAEVGSRTTLDVLNAEQELLNSQVTLVRSKRDQYVAAYALLASMGMLTARSLGLPVEIYDPKANTHSLIWKQFWPGAGE